VGKPRVCRPRLSVRDSPVETSGDPVPDLASLRVALFADGADLREIERLAADPIIRGFTTNPSLMRKAGVTDYERFARAAAEIAGDRPISFEVFSDDCLEMEQQARAISGWGSNVFVKIPVTDTCGQRTSSVIRRLVAEGIQLNVTALATVLQVEQVAACLAPEMPSFVSLFAGRIADTGRDPIPLIEAGLDILRGVPAARLIWASPREILNIFQADAVGCHVITVTSELLAKLGLVGKDLTAFSLETVRMFHDDALSAGYMIDFGVPASAG
jgi:transaldolase